MQAIDNGLYHLFRVSSVLWFAVEEGLLFRIGEAYSRFAEQEKAALSDRLADSIRHKGGTFERNFHNSQVVVKVNDTVYDVGAVQLPRSMKDVQVTYYVLTQMGVLRTVSDRFAMRRHWLGTNQIWGEVVPEGSKKVKEYDEHENGISIKSAYHVIDDELPEALWKKDGARTWVTQEQVDHENHLQQMLVKARADNTAKAKRKEAMVEAFERKKGELQRRYVECQLIDLSGEALDGEFPITLSFALLEKPMGNFTSFLKIDITYQMDAEEETSEQKTIELAVDGKYGCLEQVEGVPKGLLDRSGIEWLSLGQFAKVQHDEKVEQLRKGVADCYIVDASGDLFKGDFPVTAHIYAMSKLDDGKLNVHDLIVTYSDTGVATDEVERNEIALGDDSRWGRLEDMARFPAELLRQSEVAWLAPLEVEMMSDPLFTEYTKTYSMQIAYLRRMIDLFGLKINSSVLHGMRLEFKLNDQLEGCEVIVKDKSGFDCPFSATLLQRLYPAFDKRKAAFQAKEYHHTLQVRATPGARAGSTAEILYIVHFKRTLEGGPIVELEEMKKTFLKRDEVPDLVVKYGKVEHK